MLTSADTGRVAFVHLTTQVSRNRRVIRLKRLERMTETPMAILAIFTVPVLLGPYLWGASSDLWLEVAIWSVFAVDLAVRTAIAPGRLAYLRAHKVDVLLVVLPFLRPLRIVRLFVFALRIRSGLRQALSLERMFIYVTALAVFGASAAMVVEPETFPSFPSALWWAVVTMSTVGYGDIAPVSGAGRLVALPLLIGGIAAFGVLTATLATLMVRER